LSKSLLTSPAYCGIILREKIIFCALLGEVAQQGCSLTIDGPGQGSAGAGRELCPIVSALGGRVATEAVPTDHPGLTDYQSRVSALQKKDACGEEKRAGWRFDPPWERSAEPSSTLWLAAYASKRRRDTFSLSAPRRESSLRISVGSASAPPFLGISYRRTARCKHSKRPIMSPICKHRCQAREPAAWSDCLHANFCALTRIMN
jgi:hypothetical protein